MSLIPHDAWEMMWAPYDEPTYTAVLEQIRPDDIVLEIGAGDLRLARRIARRARRILAIERNIELIDRPDLDMPANFQVIGGDARWIPFPQDISVAVLLMRHCSSLAWYWSKLMGTRCERLITNARWGLGIETVDLTTNRLPFETVHMGWYACRCGGTGFLPGEAERINYHVLNMIWEVDRCPACRSGYLSSNLH
jgi:hypothetical protein